MKYSSQQNHFLSKTDFSSETVQDTHSDILTPSPNPVICQKYYQLIRQIIHIKNQWNTEVGEITLFLKHLFKLQRGVKYLETCWPALRRCCYHERTPHASRCHRASGGQTETAKETKQFWSNLGITTHSCLFYTLIFSINHSRTVFWLSKENKLCIFVTKMRIFGSAQRLSREQTKRFLETKSKWLRHGALLRILKLVINHSQVINVKWTLKQRYLNAVIVLFIYIYPVVSINLHSINSSLVLIACN